jgi:hypothetical protein
VGGIEIAIGKLAIVEEYLTATPAAGSRETPR